MSRRGRVIEFRNQIDANLTATRKLIRVDELTEGELSEMINLYPLYEFDQDYVEGYVFRHQGKLYKVIQPHRSQENWIPSELPALYLNLMPENVIPEWMQPTGAHDSYAIGDKVIFNGLVYESIIDSNTWAPDVHGWKLVK